MATTISWADETWNPITGCSKISEGCRHCYAERIDLKFRDDALPWTAANARANIRFHERRLNKPYQTQKPSIFFVNSMSDMFHEEVQDEWLDSIYEVMKECPQHYFLILTKRPNRMQSYLTHKPPKHIWHGVSIESKKHLDRLDVLRECPSVIRFVSFEPLLEDLGELDLSGIHWAIVGGESGPNFRPMDHAWARSIRDQIIAQGDEFFFKQSAAFRTEMGTALIEEDGSRTIWNYYPIDGMRYQREVKPLEYRFSGYYDLPDEMREELDFDDAYLDKLDGNLIENILERGKMLKKWQERLAAYGTGCFQSWIKERHQYRKSSAYRYISAYETFGICPTVGQTFSEANPLYLLSAPKTPEAAKAEAIELIESGETITNERAKELVEKHSLPPAQPEWTPSEIERKEKVLAGETVLANQHKRTEDNDGDSALIHWARQEGLAVKIDRDSDWGNPFKTPEDGTRDEVCDWYRDLIYPKKRSLHRKTHELRGKVLLCWCYPARCHGETLIDALADAPTYM